MSDLIVSFLFSIFDFILGLIPDVPAFSVLPRTYLYNIGQFLGYWTNGSALLSSLFVLLFTVLVGNLIISAVKFAYKLIPLT